MKVLIVAESCFGNTLAVSEAVAAGIRAAGGEVTLVDAASAPAPDGFDLVLVGAPTHNMGIPRPKTRLEAERSGGRAATSGVKEWLDTLPRQSGRRAATFGTVSGTSAFVGSAAKAIERILRRKGADVVARENFLVGGRSGPLGEDELVRAENWGGALVDGAR